MEDSIGPVGADGIFLLPFSPTASSASSMFFFRRWSIAKTRDILGGLGVKDIHELKYYMANRDTDA
jgi:hypothetical protein